MYFFRVTILLEHTQFRNFEACNRVNQVPVFLSPNARNFHPATESDVLLGKQHTSDIVQPHGEEEEPPLEKREWAVVKMKRRRRPGLFCPPSSGPPVALCAEGEETPKHDNI